MNDEPLIYTSKGNLPIASLEYRHSWEFRPSKETCEAIHFVEEYFLEGECVKRAAHVYVAKGLAAESAIGEM